MSNLALVHQSRPTGRRLATLVVSLSVVLGSMMLAPAPAQAAGLGCVVDPGWATMKNAWATEVTALTNAHRATLGLPALVPSNPLTDAAEWKAAHMANYGYMSHDDPAPPVDRPWDERIEDCGYTHGMGENIAFGYRSPKAVVEGWIGSTGHRRNIENPDYRVIGVGAAVDEEGTPYWAQTFGTHVDTEEPAPGIPSVDPGGAIDTGGPESDGVETWDDESDRPPRDVDVDDSRIDEVEEEDSSGYRAGRLSKLRRWVMTWRKHTNL